MEVKNLIKKFQTGDTELIALKNLSFTVPTGQFLAITGRSGSGKSTLLYQMSLLDRANEGKLIIDDQEVSAFTNDERVAYRRDNFGFVFQDYALLPVLTAKENVMLPMLMQGVAKSITREKTEKALQRVGLSDRFDYLPSQLSGGQQQRVSIARAIAHNPRIVFADEPTANLDTESSKIVLDIFLELNKSGQTIIMVTHEPDYAKLADRRIELLDGDIVNDIGQKKGKK
ncbi:MAG: ABC transporter ATP-binding protein [Patescibacteria group bacterium]